MKGLFVVALLAVTAMAQVPSKGKWTPRQLSAAQQEDSFQAAFVVPAQNNEALLTNEDSSHGGFQFATPVDVRINPDNYGRVFEVAQGRVWVLDIISKGAKSLSVTFDKFHLPEGAELYAYNDAKVLGAFTSQNNKNHGWFSIAPLSGSMITLELYLPRGVTELPSISIAKVAHGYKEIAFGSSGRCNINVICEDGDAWRAQIRGVAMMLTQFGSRYCSGSMISNALQDGRQLYLTAAHCIGGNVASDQVMFNYESEICDLARQTDGPTTMTASGLRNLAQYASSDFSLFEVEETIPAAWNVHLNGFSAANTAASRMVGIHHPSGDIKKISFANKTAVPTRWGTDPNYHWEVPSWDAGTTEPGSSGSPLFDQNRRIVGQLHGGAASCSNIAYDSYGAVWASWDRGASTAQRLQPHLDPNNSGTLIVDGIDLNVARARKNQAIPK